MAGIAGASLSLALINLFQENMTSGMGYIAVALVYFGGWRPAGVLGGSLFIQLRQCVPIVAASQRGEDPLKHCADAALHLNYPGAYFCSQPRPAASRFVQTLRARRVLAKKAGVNPDRQ